jgi:hypothetical protein
MHLNHPGIAVDGKDEGDAGYYCTELLAETRETRRIAARGLRLLQDIAATPCLERGLAAESDEATAAEIRAGLDRFVPMAPVRQFAELAAAQLGQLSGIVRDDGGGELPGVTVTASGPTLSETRTTESDGRGQYAVADLASGDYVLRFSLGGAFEDCRVDARITADRRTVMDVVMRPKSMPPRAGVPACGKPGQ